MNSYRNAAALLAGTALLVASPAFAINTGDIGVSLTIEEECTMATNNLDFGTTGIIDEDMLTSATLTIECTSESPYAIALDEGDNPSAADDVDTRRLESAAGHFINYQLYSDAGRTTVWGKTIGDDTIDSVSAAGADEVFTVYARVPSHQNVPAGEYADTVTATVWYGEDLEP